MKPGIDLRPPCLNKGKTWRDRADDFIVLETIDLRSLSPQLPREVMLPNDVTSSYVNRSHKKAERRAPHVLT